MLLLAPDRTDASTEGSRFESGANASWRIACVVVASLDTVPHIAAPKPACASPCGRHFPTNVITVRQCRQSACPASPGTNLFPVPRAGSPFRFVIASEVEQFDATLTPYTACTDHGCKQGLQGRKWCCQKYSKATKSTGRNAVVSG